MNKPKKNLAKKFKCEICKKDSRLPEDEINCDGCKKKVCKKCSKTSCSRGGFIDIDRKLCHYCTGKLNDPDVDSGWM